MRFRVIAAIIGVVVSSAHGAAAADIPPQAQPACAVSMSASAGRAPSTTMVRLYRSSRDFAGTLRLYAGDRVWTAPVASGDVARLGSRERAEQDVLVQTPQPVIGVVYEASWPGAPCKIVAPVGARGSSDPPDPPRSIAASDAGPVAAPSCAHPFAPPVTVRASEPMIPVIAMQQGIVGTVHVAVALDEASRVVNVSLVSTPSALLSASSLEAARQSVYRTAIIECRPEPSAYDFVVDYSMR